MKKEQLQASVDGEGNMGEIDFTRYDASKPIREITYEALKDAIIAGDILPGERIVESSFAKRLNISRTPIREALRKLEQDGLVIYTPRKGVVVKSLEEKDINDIYTIRTCLETLAMTKAVENVTTESIAKLRAILAAANKEVEEGNIENAAKIGREMHLEIYQMSGMDRLVGILSSLDEYMDRFSYMSMSDEERRHTAAREHTEMVDALEKRDLETLIQVSDVHLEGARIKCLHAYAQHREDAKKRLEEGREKRLRNGRVKDDEDE